MFAQAVTYQIGPIVLLALFNFGFGIYYLISTVLLGRKNFNSLSKISAKIIFLIRILIISLIFALSGLVLFVNGWRLDPIFVFHQFVLTIFLCYLALKHRQYENLRLRRKF